MRKQLIEIFAQLPNNIEVKVLKISKIHEFTSEHKFASYLNEQIIADEKIVKWTSMMNDSKGKNLN